MKNKLLLTLLCIFIQINANAQSSPLWTKNMDAAPDYLFPVKTKVDIFGNVVALCVQSAVVGIDQKIYLRKFTTNGNIIWTQIYDNAGIGSPRGFDMDIDSSGNIYVAGGLMTNDNPFLIKFNSSGTFVWQRSSTTAFSLGWYQQMIMKNNLLYVQSTSGIAVFDFFGNEQWSITGMVPTKIAVDNAGRVIASVSNGPNTLARYNTDGSLNFQDSTIVAADIEIDYWNNIFLINSYGVYDIVRYDSSGTLSWKIEAIAQCPPFGDIGVELIIDFDLNVLAIGLNDTIYKYDYLGNYIWKRSMNGLDSYKSSSSLFNNNYILIAGSITDSLENNVRVATFDAMGNQNWYGDYNSNSVQEFVESMTFDDSGIYILEDSISNSDLIKFDFPFVNGTPLDFNQICVDSVWYDPLNPLFINIRVFNANFSHMNYPSIQMLNPSGDTISNNSRFVNFFAHIGNTYLTYSDSITEFGITDFSQYRFAISEGFNDTTVEIFWCLTSDIADPNETHLGVYPNPTNGNVHIMPLPNGETGTLQVFDSNGRLCVTAQIESGNNEVDLQNLSSGMYFMRLTSKSGVRNGKVIKQ